MADTMRWLCWIMPMIVCASSLWGAEVPGDVRSFLDTFCVNCHGPLRKKAGIDLSHFADTNLVRNPDLWVKVRQQVLDQTMPPRDKKQPAIEEREKAGAAVDQMLDAFVPAKGERDPGHVILHRLSRFEYNNTVRDLFGADWHPADHFPPDGGGGGGFDNNAATLFIPPILMEKYMEAASEIVEKAIPEKLFLVRPGFWTSAESAGLRTIEQQATRIFRRSMRADELRTWQTLFRSVFAKTRSYETSIRETVAGMLASPNFLFRVEAGAKGTRPAPISDSELAVRLAYFLWSSTPDSELLDLGIRGRLRDKGVLEKQVNRMLRDPRASALAENFAGQWLGVKNLRTTTHPDPGRFPQFTPALRESMIAEPIVFFQNLVRENQSLLKLIQSDFTFANEELARFYGIPGVSGSEFQRVSLPDARRGGVIGMAGVLTVTSYPLRTSPVLRGKWILEQVLGTPPPPPPPLVKSLPPDDPPKGAGETFKKQLETHRANPNCAGCHQRMDPLGFSLENFDALGRWRDTINGQPVDAQAQLPSGEKINGPADLRQALLAREDLFVKNLTEKMLAYALGRGLEFPDRVTVREIMEAAKKDQYRASTWILEMVKSYPFQNRRGQAATPSKS